jgi:peptidoglycan hydrolase CwlO-like protein
MRMMSIMLALAMLTISAAPAFSEMTKADKDECMLASKNCTNQVDDIYKRMHRLDKEIKKGKKVYTPAELKKLQDKLTETQELLKTMERPGK